MAITDLPWPLCKAMYFWRQQTHLVRKLQYFPLFYIATCQANMLLTYVLSTCLSHALIILSWAFPTDCTKQRTFHVMGVGYFTIFLLISWKWISHTLSTTSSFSKVTNPNPAKNPNNSHQILALDLWWSHILVLTKRPYPTGFL